MILKVNNKEYDLKFTTRSCVKCEQRIGTNPINVFMEASNGKIPKMNDLLIILHECLIPFNHGMTLDDVYTLYDKYCEEGGTILTLVKLLVDVFTECGFVPKDEGKN